MLTSRTQELGGAFPGVLPARRLAWRRGRHPYLMSWPVAWEPVASMSWRHTRGSSHNHGHNQKVICAVFRVSAAMRRAAASRSTSSSSAEFSDVTAPCVMAAVCHGRRRSRAVARVSLSASCRVLKPGGCYMLTCSAPPGLHSELLLRLPFLYLTVSILLCLLCQLCQLGSVVITYNNKF